MKTYSNSIRKPMMYGGGVMKPKKPMMGGGAVRKKRKQGTPTGTMGEKANSMTAEERESLIKEQIRLENLQDENAATPQQMERLKVIYDKLGLSATPGRANVDR